ncbi:hypothetical protein ILUMI_18492 [Ignelater luminosus]|uniref:Uncharacterized protein n=1 Tax=Ignelater luminosus TaxID=2038154 RepID=A0A8K0CMF2_IGNLU|nr:hypothetical protein ILUMI_18492 [Ignelater luminosus]
MLTSVPQEFRKFARHCYTLRIILKDTQRSLDDIRSNLVLGADLKEKLLNQEIIGTLQHVLDDCYPAFLIFGQHCHAKALFINYILDQTILPLHSCNWRWVRLSYGHTKEIRLTLGQEYEIVEKLKAHERPWTTVPESDILRSDQESPAEHCPALEIKLNSSFLKDKVNMLVPPDCPWEHLSEVITKCLDNILPVIIYVVSDETLSDAHIQEIRKIKKTYQDLPLLFVSMSDNETSLASESLTESEQHFLEQASNQPVFKKKYADKCNTKTIQLRNQLLRLGYLNDDEHNEIEESQMEQSFCAQCAVSNSLINDYECKDKFVIFVRRAFKSYLLKMSSTLSEIHNYCLKSFILTAFDMAREIQITPRRIKYAQATEGELYKSLMKIAGQKQEEITKIIQSTLQDMKSNVAEVLEGYYYRAVSRKMQAVRLCD